MLLEIAKPLLFNPLSYSIFAELNAFQVTVSYRYSNFLPMQFQNKDLCVVEHYEMSHKYNYWHEISK